MRYTRGIASAAAVAAAIAAVGCGSTSSSSGGTGGSGGSGGELGVVLIAANDAANQAMLSGAKTQAKAKGWKVSVVDANGSADQANSAVQNFVTRKVSGILIAAFPTTSLRSGLLAAKAAKIPVATWGGGVAPGVTVANAATGYLATPIADKIVQDLGGKGEVLALTYHTGMICRVREQAFDKVMAANPGIKVTKQEVSIPGFVQAGEKLTTGWIAGKPSTEKLAVWGCWDGPTVGAVSALKQAGRTDVTTYGQNGQPDALNLIKKGTFTATNWEDSVAEGTQLASALQDAAAGKGQSGQILQVPGVVVDKSNVAAFLQKHPTAIG